MFRELSEAKITKWKEEIDSMSHEQMAYLWRYAPAGHVYFDKTLPLYAYFKERFDMFGGMTSQISKAISD